MEQELCESALLELPLSSNRPLAIDRAPTIGTPMALHT